jgi:hypothetical protein
MWLPFRNRLVDAEWQEGEFWCIFPNHNTGKKQKYFYVFLQSVVGKAVLPVVGISNRWFTFGIACSIKFRRPVALPEPQHGWRLERNRQPQCWQHKLRLPVHRRQSL